MNNYKFIDIELYANLVQHVSSLLALSFAEIKKRYANYPHCVIDYFEEGSREKSIEIELKQEEIVISCLFDEKDKCKVAFLFPDKNELAEKPVILLKQSYHYDFFQNRWKISNYYVQLKKSDEFKTNYSFMFYT